MKNIPVTYLVPYVEDEKTRRIFLKEFAVNGAENIVLSDGIISAIKLDPGKAELFLKEASDVNLKYVDAHAPFGAKVDMNNADDNNILVLNHILHLHIAALMGVKTITIHIGNDTNALGVSAAQQTDRICFMLDKLLKEAEKLDVSIALENIWLPINTPENLWQIKKRFPTEYLGFCYDAGHANIMNNGRYAAESVARDYWSRVNAGEPAWDDRILEKMLPEVITCHLHDNCGNIDTHELPGNGDIDWVKTVELLKSAPRLKAVQSEVILTRSKASIQELVGKFKELFA